MFSVGAALKAKRQSLAKFPLLAKVHLSTQPHLQATIPLVEDLTYQWPIRKHRRGSSTITVNSTTSIVEDLTPQLPIRKHRRGSSTRTLNGFEMVEESGDDLQLTNDIYDSDVFPIAIIPTTVIAAEIIAQEVLNILTVELPDPCQDLSFQSLLTDFTCFGELPLELRRSIWSFTFPYIPTVHLAIQYPREEGKHYAPFPSALHICHDSRVEALRHFRFFSQTSMFYFFDDNLKVPYSLTPRPICFSLDTRSISFIFRDFESPGFLSFLLHFQFEIPECVYGIHKVVIKESVWRLYTKMCFHMRTIDTGRPIYLKQVLTAWRGLDVVELEYDLKSDEEYMMRRGKKDECRNEVRRWFLDLQHSGVNVKIPEVYTSHVPMGDDE